MITSISFIGRKFFVVITGMEEREKNESRDVIAGISLIALFRVKNKTLTPSKMKGRIHWPILCF